MSDQTAKRPATDYAPEPESAPLALNAETLQDLSAPQAAAENVKGGARPWSGGHTCSPTDNCI